MRQCLKFFIPVALLMTSTWGMSQARKGIGAENVRKTLAYPNPARAFVRIQYKANEPVPATLSIFNFMGKKQMETHQPGNNIYIDLSDFKRGIYIYQYRDRNGQVIDTGKFQVEK